MSNKTILISTNDSNTLTSFDQNKTPNYSDYKVKAKSTFKRRRVKPKNDYDISINPFINASSSIFKSVIDIKKENNNDLLQIKEEFIEKINNYDELTRKNGLDERECLATRYIICTFIDEMMNTTSMGSKNNWSNNSILNIFHNETYGGDNFFNLLDKFLIAPAKYIHILELMYVCLALGFQGKYRVMNRGSLELDNLKESLFRQIKIVQGKEPFNFYTKQEPSKDKFTLFHKVPYELLFFIVSFLLIIIYFSLSYALNSQNSEFENILKEDKTYINSNIYKRVAK